MELSAELERIQALHAAGRDAEALTAAEALVGALPADLPDEARLKALWTWADLRSHADLHEPAIQAYRACLPLLERLNRASARVVAHNNLGYHLAQLGRREEALGALREARELSRAVGQPALLRAYWGLSFWHLAWGQLDEAESAARVAIQQARAWGEPGELGTVLVQLGQTLAKAGRADRALLALTEGIACLEKAGRPVREAEAALAALSSAPGGTR